MIHKIGAIHQIELPLPDTTYKFTTDGIYPIAKPESSAHPSMLTLYHHSFLRHLPHSSSSSSSSLPSLLPPNSIKRFGVVRASMDEPAAPSPVMEFPHLPPSHRDLMVDLLSTIETQLGTYLLPSAVPSDVLSFRGQGGASQGALDIRSGSQDSSVRLPSCYYCYHFIPKQ